MKDTPSSGLAGLKRSWSGNVIDIDSDSEDSGVVGIKRRGAQAGKWHDVTNSISSPQQQMQQDHDAELWDPTSLTSTVITTSGTKLSQETSDSYSRNAKQREGKENTETLAETKRRQIPSVFGKGRSNDSQANWTKPASELKTSNDRLSFLVKGSGSNPSAGRRSLESRRSPSKIFLSKEQNVVHELCVNGRKNIFFTGSAGTGKSVVLREIITSMKKKYESKIDAVAVTASTGIAACNIGGVTLHSFAGVGLGIEPESHLVRKVKMNRKAVSRWLRTQVLVIDEISMVDPKFLDKLEYIARTLRRSDKPFGGMQIIMTGDFFQLPPVVARGTSTRYAFDANCWDSIAEEKINLTQVFRQKDPEFVALLNELRYGTLNFLSMTSLASLSGKSKMEESSGMQPTCLFPTRQEVEKANAQELVKIKRPVHTFEAADKGSLPKDILEKTLANFMAPKVLRLKMGSQVMLIKNSTEFLVNGSVGTVLTFLTSKSWYTAQLVRFDWDAINPLKSTEEEIEEMIQREHEVFRVKLDAATRAGSPIDMDEVEYIGGKTRYDYAETLQKEIKKERLRSRSASPEKTEPKRYPIVRFLVPGGRWRTVQCLEENWVNEQPNGEVVASRTQIPLILAWALSIHKSQGQTLPLVKIDLGRVFEKGQAYVALSRAVSKEGLQVMNFDPGRVHTDRRVIDWYKQLPTVD